MAILPQSLRSRTPGALRDDRRLRAAALGLGLIPPRTMHSREDSQVLLAAARGAVRAVEIGVYEGSSALLLLDALGPQAELHLIDPFGRRPDALPPGWGASEWATRRTVGRRVRELAGRAPRVVWHPALSHEVAGAWEGPADLVFIDGEHSYEGCLRDWREWRGFVPAGGRVVFHDARSGAPGGRGLPGPTAVVEGEVLAGGQDEWELMCEADRTVAVRRRP